MVVIIKPTATDYKTLRRDTENGRLQKDGRKHLFTALVGSVGLNPYTPNLRPFMEDSIYSAFLGRIILSFHLAGEILHRGMPANRITPRNQTRHWQSAKYLLLDNGKVKYST